MWLLLVLGDDGGGVVVVVGGWPIVEQRTICIHFIFESYYTNLVVIVDK